MSADARRHFVIAIYGVGNPAPGDVERSLAATLDAVADGMPFEVHEFDWNQFAAHAPRAKGRLWRYAQWFSGSFASAAWVRTSRPTSLERARAPVDAVAHGLWAATQSLFAVMVVLGIALSVVGALSDAFSGWIRPLTSVGVLPGGVGWRASVLGSDLLGLGYGTIRYGSVTTAALLAVSIAMAVLEALVLRSTRPLAATARRHAFVVLLVPCVLLSLVTFRREDRESLFDVAHSIGYWILMAIGIAAMAIVSIFFGGARTTLAWSLVIPAILAAFIVCSIVARFLREKAAPTWLAPAKVLLDIGLYVGMPSYRMTIQENLDRIIAAIPDRSTTAIWIVAHSLGSVIALDSLTNGDEWQSTDRVRLVTLGSPIRKFFIRFFPGAFVEPQIDVAARRVAGRVGEFIWLNAFRRFDYIGTALGFRERGLDLPTKQMWPAHANYWGDIRVARTVFAGWQRASAIERPRPSDTARTAPLVLGEIPGWVKMVFRWVAVAGGVAIVALTAGTALWLLYPGLREMVVRPTMHIETPASTTAHVHHERGFSGDGARMHEFRFDFRDEATGHEHHISASVPGFFGLWSDPRFDYLALARFIRADCKPERAARFYELGWSVPCSRDELPITYDRSEPSRFRVPGFEDTPGYFVLGCRALFKLVAVVFGILCVLAIAVVVPALWLVLWGLFVGDHEISELILDAWQAVGGA